MADIRAVLVEITATLGEHGRMLERLDATVRHLDEAVRGNGKPGLRQEVQDLRSNLLECQRRRDQMAADAARHAQTADKWWTRIVQPGVVLGWAAVAALLILGFSAWNAKTSRDNVRAEVRSALEDFQAQGEK